ncbi:MAG: hypothetical protein JXR76_31300 [Deltaproteobacteria bacterium]|nr:hypothetical protein [Deltaproteobacteria bacterium]
MNEPSTDNALKPAPAAMTFSSATARRIYPQIQRGKRLAALSVGLWTTAHLMQVFGGLTAIFRSGSTANMGLGIFFGAIGLELLSPIPAAIGEKKAKNAIGQRDRKGIGRDKGASSGIIYGSGLLCIGNGLLLAYVALQGEMEELGEGFKTLLAGVLFMLIGKGLLAKAPFEALIRLRQFEKKHFSNIRLAPQIGSNVFGLSLCADF